MKSTSRFARRGPDVLAQELATVLSTNSAFEFKPLFEIILANLRARNAASGGQEMLRLRTYEKLQNLVTGGIVQKTGKLYRAVAPALASYLEQASAANAAHAAKSRAKAASSSAAAAA